MNNAIATRAPSVADVNVRHAVLRNAAPRSVKPKPRFTALAACARMVNSPTSTVPARIMGDNTTTNRLSVVIVVTNIGSRRPCRIPRTVTSTAPNVANRAMRCVIAVATRGSRNAYSAKPSAPTTAARRTTMAKSFSKMPVKACAAPSAFRNAGERFDPTALVRLPTMISNGR